MISDITVCCGGWGVTEQSSIQRGGWEAEAENVCDSWLSELHLSTQGPQPEGCATNNRDRSSPTRSASGNLHRHQRMCFSGLLAISQSNKIYKHDYLSQKCLI